MGKWAKGGKGSPLHSAPAPLPARAMKSKGKKSDTAKIINNFLLQQDLRILPVPLCVGASSVDYMHVSVVVCVSHHWYALKMGAFFFFGVRQFEEEKNRDSSEKIFFSLAVCCQECGVPRRGSAVAREPTVWTFYCESS